MPILILLALDCSPLDESTNALKQMPYTKQREDQAKFIFKFPALNKRCLSNPYT
jgi:hypothetical protein